MEDHPRVKNAATPGQVNWARRKDRRVEVERKALVGQQLATPPGRRFVWEELARHGIFESITVQSSMIYALSGRRDAGLELLAEVQAFPELYLQMQAEAMQRKAHDDHEAAANQQEHQRVEP